MMVVLFSVSERQEKRRVKVGGNFYRLEVLIVKENNPVRLGVVILLWHDQRQTSGIKTSNIF